jgi:hypothetical protein
MSALQALLSAVCVALICATLAGLARRRLYRLCYSFTAYLAAVALGEALILLWPDTFYRWAFWQGKETVYGLLKLGIGLELGSLTFQAFPGASARARLIALLALLFILAAMLTLTPAPHEDLSPLQALAVELQSGLANGTVLLLALTWILVFWYHVPLHRLHRAILRGLGLYLMVSSAALKLVGNFPELRDAVSYGTGIAYVALVGYWAWEAWRPEREIDKLPIWRRLQPWRDRL